MLPGRGLLQNLSVPYLHHSPLRRRTPRGGDDSPRLGTRVEVDRDQKGDRPSLTSGDPPYPRSGALLPRVIGDLARVCDRAGDREAAGARDSSVGDVRFLQSLDGAESDLPVRFYEWTVGSDGKKQPIHFHLPGYELFVFAGLWTTRTDDGSGEILESCTIITTRPNELVAPVHDRMPVILRAEAERVWLDPTIAKEHALSLLEPYPAELMVALPASTRVNSVRNDDPGLLLPDDALAA
jgi:hypothetical protein